MGRAAQTIAGWLKIDQSGTYEFLCYGQRSSRQLNAMSIYGTNPAFASHGDDLSTSASVALGTWNQYAMTFDGDRVKLYLNGSLIGTKTIPLDTLLYDAGLLIGAHVESPGNYNYFWYFKGVIDEVGIWSRALTADEITALWNNGAGRTPDAAPVAPIVADIPDSNIMAGIPYTGPTPTLVSGTPPITWSLETYPPGMTIDAPSGIVSWPVPTTVGSPHTVTIRATNAAGSDTESWQLTVAPLTFPTHYLVQDIGDLGGGVPTETYAVDINSLGHVCGYSTDSGGLRHAFLWDGATMRNLGEPAGHTEGFGAALNNSDVVAGSVGAPLWSNSTRPCVWDAGTITVVTCTQCIGYGQVAGIANDGTVVGSQMVNNGAGAIYHAFRWDGTLHELGLYAAWHGSAARTISSCSGQIGGLVTISNGPSFPTLWGRDDQYIYPHYLPGFDTSGEIRGINNLGQAVGVYGDQSQHAFRWDPSDPNVAYPLPTLGGPKSQATAIDDAGAILGWADNSQGNGRAVAWVKQQIIVDLNTCLPPDSGWVLTSAMGRNAAGQIVANGRQGSGPPHGVVLMPDSDGDGVADAGDVIGDPCDNRAPVANAGADQTVSEGTVVTLEGSGSQDPDGDALTYTWTRVAGPTVTLDLPDSVHPTFTAPFVPIGGATLTFQLVVSDGRLLSEPDVVNVSIANVNHAPVAVADGPVAVVEGGTATLNGSQSYDVDDDPLTFTWTQTAGTPVVLDLTDPAKPQFTAPLVGPAGETLTFVLVVSDTLDSDADTVIVLIENVNHDPTANAGLD